MLSSFKKKKKTETGNHLAGTTIFSFLLPKILLLEICLQELQAHHHKLNLLVSIFSSVDRSITRITPFSPIASADMDVFVDICDTHGACSKSANLSVRVCDTSLEEAQNVTESILDEVFVYLFYKYFIFFLLFF